MKKIVFIATYPTKLNIKDGMMQRIKAVDMEFETKDRLYLSIGRRVNFILQKDKISDTLTVVNLNLFLHFWLIAFYLWKHKNFYIHSLFNFNLVKNLSSFKGKNVCIDVHGSVPEEFDFYGNKTMAEKMNKLEKRFFSISSTIICVSQQMRNYYLTKHPFIADKRIIVKPIFSTNVLRSVSDSEIESLGIPRDKTILLYSGNLQKWQNFELIIEVIQKIIRPDYHIVILTGELENAKNIIAKYNLPPTQITIKSVQPTDLPAYYSIAHYGFILRDEHILNKVAAPTKLIEYLYYGLTPIVKYTDVGDAALMQYDFIEYDNIPILESRKSIKNRDIAQRILEQNGDNELTNIFGCDQ